MPTVRDVMTPDPVALEGSTPLSEAAKQMKERDIGSVIVLDGEQACGIVTDRDIVVRGVADFEDLSSCSLGDVCSDQLLTATPDEDITAAIGRMREAAVRRIPVVEGGKPVGVLSIGDAAIERDSRSALADISVEEGNT